MPTKPLQSSFVYHQPPPTAQSLPNTREVRVSYGQTSCRANISTEFVLAYQLSVSTSSCIVSTISRLCVSHYQVLGPTGVHLPSTEAQGR